MNAAGYGHGHPGAGHRGTVPPVPTRAGEEGGKYVHYCIVYIPLDSVGVHCVVQ